MTIELYLNKSPFNKIFKELISKDVYEGVLVGEFSEETPMIRIRNVPSDCNYAKINDKYYFITDINHTTQNISVVSLKIDYLYTYREDIMKMEGFVLRNGNVKMSNTEIDDPSAYVFRKRKNIIRENLSTGFDESEMGGCYVLAVSTDGAKGAVGDGL